jgi:hypothetical protein
VRRPFAAAIAMILVVVATACGGGSGSSSTSAPKCEKAPEGIGPDAKATLQDADAGRTVCLNQGDVLTVFLHARQGEDRWGPITTSDRHVLKPRSSGVLTLPIGVTGAVYAGAGKGTARLTSTRPPCNPPSRSGCDAAHEWTARVVVR